MGTWIVGGAVFILIALAARKVYRDKKSGKSCGSCEGCAGCSAADERKAP